MKTAFMRFLTALSLAGFTSWAMAVQFSVEDISNRVVTCNSPLLANARPGSCLVVPSGTLWVTATLDAEDQPDVLDNLYFVVQENGQFFQYRSDANVAPTERWQETSIDGRAGMPPLAPSSQRFPFETTAVGRKINLGHFSSRKGAKLFVGVRSNNSAEFTRGSVREIHTVR